MGSEEENAVRYASGYVAMKLRKEFMKKESEKAPYHARMPPLLSRITCLCCLELLVPEKPPKATSWIKFLNLRIVVRRSSFSECST